MVLRWWRRRSGGRVNEPILSPSLYMMVAEKEATGASTASAYKDNWPGLPHAKLLHLFAGSGQLQADRINQGHDWGIRQTQAG